MSTEQRAEWLKNRKTYIGGTDISAIAGVNKYKTALQVYLDKIGELPEQEENEAMEWGNRLEEPVAQKYADETGFAVLKPESTIFHKDYPFLGANIDRWVYPVLRDEHMEKFLVDQAWILECKTAGHFSSKEWGVDEYSEDMPVQYHTQVAWYSAICNVPKVDVAVLIGGQTFKRYTYNKDVDHEKNLIEIGVRFWKNHVEKRIPPEPTNNDDLRLLYPSSVQDKVVIADSEIEQAILTLKSLKTDAKDLEQAIKDQEFIIKNHMKDAEVLMLGDSKLATYKTDKESLRLDSNILKEQHKEVYENCLRPSSPIRRFLVK